MRRRSSFILALIVQALALLGGCTVLYQSQSVKKLKSLEDVQCVAVLPFDNQSGYVNAGNIVADLFSTNLYATRKVRLMERGEILRVLSERNILVPRSMDPTYAKRLGEILGVDHVVIGSVSEFIYDSLEGGSRPLDTHPVVSFTTRLVDVKSGETVWSASYSRTSQDVFTLQRDPVTRLTGMVVQDMTKRLTADLPPRDVKPGDFCGRGGEEIQLVSTQEPRVEDENLISRMQLEILRLAKELDNSRQGRGGGLTYDQLKAEHDRLQQELAVKELQLKGLKRPDVAALTQSGKDQFVIHFEAGQVTLRPGAYVILDQFAELLQRFPRNMVIIEGHSDNQGNKETRYQASIRRATETQMYLMTRWNIPPEKIFVKGYGDFKPIHDNNTPFGRTLNRRVELVLVEVPQNEQASLLPSEGK